MIKWVRSTRDHNFAIRVDTSTKLGQWYKEGRQMKEGRKELARRIYQRYAECDDVEEVSEEAVAYWRLTGEWPEGE